MYFLVVELTIATTGLEMEQRGFHRDCNQTLIYCCLLLFVENNHGNATPPANHPLTALAVMAALTLVTLSSLVLVFQVRSACITNSDCAVSDVCEYGMCLQAARLMEPCSLTAQCTQHDKDSVCDDNVCKCRTRDTVAGSSCSNHHTTEGAGQRDPHAGYEECETRPCPAGFVCAWHYGLKCLPVRAPYQPCILQIQCTTFARNTDCTRDPDIDYVHCMCVHGWHLNDNNTACDPEHERVRVPMPVRSEPEERRRPAMKLALACLLTALALALCLLAYRRNRQAAGLAFLLWQRSSAPDWTPEIPGPLPGKSAPV